MYVGLGVKGIEFGESLTLLMTPRRAEPRPAQRPLQIVQMRAPHIRRVAKMRAVATLLAAPPIGPRGAVAKVPPPSRPRERVEWQPLHVRILAAG